MFNSKIFFLFFLLSSFGLRAELTELAPGLIVDTEKFVQRLDSCGEGVPGEVCLMQCYDINNTATANYYTCDLQATGSFVEKINTADGSILYTGNTLSATDYRSVVVYPYQQVSICFNYGKEVVSTPQQPSSLWVYKDSSIIAPDGCAGGSEGPEPDPTEATSTFI